MRIATRWAGGLLAALLAWLFGVAYWIWSGPVEDTAATADTAIVLGAAVDDHVPSPVFAARIDHAVNLYQAGRVRSITFTGARSPEDSLSEAVAAQVYAEAAGVPASDIATETRSRTTFQNLDQAKRVMGAQGLTSALIVSDPLHLRRAQMMANDMGVEAQSSAAQQTRYRSWSTKLPFLLREVYFVHHYWLLGE